MPRPPTRSAAAGRTCPVLFVTGYADTTALMKVGAVGEERIVQKPFRGGEPERKVAAALRNRPVTQLRLVSDQARGVL